MFPACQGNLKKSKKNPDFDPSGVQRIDGVVCMVIENYFASCIFWFMLFVIVVTLKLVRLKNLLETKLQFKYQIPRN